MLQFSEYSEGFSLHKIKMPFNKLFNLLGKHLIWVSFSAILCKLKQIGKNYKTENPKRKAE